MDRFTNHENEALDLIVDTAAMWDLRPGTGITKWAYDVKKERIHLDVIHLATLVNEGWLTKQNGPYNHVDFDITSRLVSQAQHERKKWIEIYFGLDTSTGHSLTTMYKLSNGLYRCNMKHQPDNKQSAWNVWGESTTAKQAYKNALSTVRNRLRTIDPQRSKRYPLKYHLTQRNRGV